MLFMKDTVIIIAKIIITIELMFYVLGTLLSKFFEGNFKLN